MPSDPLLDPEELLAPIPGDDPAGRRVVLPKVDNRLKEYQEDFDPERDLSEDDRRNPQFAEAKRKVSAVEQDRRGGDQVPQVEREGPGGGRPDDGGADEAERVRRGLKTGFRLLRRLCEDCWDRMHPALDPDDPDSVTDRTSKLDWLDEPEKKPYFPTTDPVDPDPGHAGRAPGLVSGVPAEREPAAPGVAGRVPPGDEHGPTGGRRSGPGDGRGHRRGADGNPGTADGPRRQGRRHVAPGSGPSGSTATTARR